MQVSEAFREAGIEPVPTEGDFRLQCDECDSMQRLRDMERADVAGVTIYACRSCGRSLVGVKSFKEDAEAREASDTGSIATWSEVRSICICMWPWSVASPYG